MYEKMNDTIFTSAKKSRLMAEEHKPFCVLIARKTAVNEQYTEKRY